MKSILDFGFWILDWATRGIGAAGVCACTLLLGACATGPNYPDPQPGYGQILVKLNGVPKEGVTGPKREEVRGEYSSMLESVEQGKAFERVDYESIDDVVALLKDASSATTGFIAPLGSGTLTVEEAGFDRLQVVSLAVAAKGTRPPSLTVTNMRATPVTIYGYSDDNRGFEVEVPANSTAEASVVGSGLFDVFCLEDPDLHCRWIVATEGWVWQGPSEHGAFFDELRGGDYEIHVYAPRLPVRTARASVTLGKRTQIAVDLTVNDLPKAK